MRYELYTREDGAYILFPEGSGALADAESLHGALQLRHRLFRLISIRKCSSAPARLVTRAEDNVP